MSYYTIQLVISFIFFKLILKNSLRNLFQSEIIYFNYFQIQESNLEIL